MGQGKEAFSVHADPEPGGPQRTGDVPGNVACRVVHEHVCVLPTTHAPCLFPYTQTAPLPPPPPPAAQAGHYRRRGRVSGLQGVGRGEAHTCAPGNSWSAQLAWFRGTTNRPGSLCCSLWCAPHLPHPHPSGTRCVPRPPPPHPPPSRCPSLCPLRSPFSSSLRSTGELCTSTSFAQASAAPIATRSSGRCRTGVCLVCLAS